MKTDSTEDLIARARLVQETTRQTVKDLQGTIDKRNMSRKIVDLELQVRDMRNLFIPLLQEFECKFDNDERCESTEIAKNYVDAATFMRDRYGRKGDRIDQVQAWIDSPDSLPY